LDVLRSYGTSKWKSKINKFFAQQGSLLETYQNAREQNKVPLQVADGKVYKLSPGKHNKLEVAIVEEFAPRFAPGAKLIYLGDTADKILVFDNTFAKSDVKKQGFSSKVGLREHSKPEKPMTEILALLQNIEPVVSATILQQMSHVIYGMLISNGRITMLEISRWTEAGGSYRTIQRLYHTPLLWLQIQWIFFVSQLQKPNDEYIAAGDEVVFGKAGKETYGIGRFFSSLQNRVIPGLSFFVFSVINVKERQSYPIQVVQMVKEKEENRKKAKKKAIRKERCPEPVEGKRSVGRPKGSKNKKNEKPRLSPELLRIQPVLQAFLAILKGVLAVQYLVMDGHFGNYPSAWMVLQTGLQFVSKLRSDAALYEPFAGKYCGRGARPKYGDKVDVRKMKRKYLKSDKKEDGVRLAMADAIHLVFVIAFVSAALGLATVFFTPHQELKEKSLESSPPLVSMD